MSIQIMLDLETAVRLLQALCAAQVTGSAA
jgi:hypothetical protein